MNIQRYATIYTKFHSGALFDASLHKMTLSFLDVPINKHSLLRLTNFDKIFSPCTLPLLEALKTFYKSEAVCSAFLKNQHLNILMGNERIVYPVHENGSCHLVATPFFVKNPTVFANYLKGHARMVYENVYTFQNSVIYLDPYDIPSPGQNYFQQNEPNSLYRICFLTQNVQQVNTNVWLNRKEVFHIPYKTKLSTATPNFIHYQPVDEIPISNVYAKSTGTIQKRQCFQNTKFLLQDIFNSYSDSLHGLGVIIEYPFCVGFDGTCESTNKFVTLCVNGNIPKKTIVVKIPYDRYVEYEYVPAARWCQIYYEKRPSFPLERVIIQSVVIGFVYRDVFLCLNHPMLSNLSNYPNLNTHFLCKSITDFDITKDSTLNVLDTYKFDCTRVLHRIKHKDIPHELWCISLNSESDSFPKRINPPHLVDHWIDFYIRNCKKSNLDFTNLDVVKLAFVLSRHKVCYKIKLSNKPRQMELDNEGIVFRLDDKAAQFLNEIRLDDKQEEKSDCSIM